MGIPNIFTYDNCRTNTFFAAFYELRRRIAADEFYLGEPKHIVLRHPAGSTARRKMRTPPRNAPASNRYYAVSCGADVGIFLNW